MEVDTTFNCINKRLERFRCPTCTFQAQLRVVLNQHIKLCHIQTSIDKNKGENCYFQVMFDLTEILKRYSCGGCRFRTFSQLIFMKHIANCIHHGKCRWYHCEMCQFKSKWKGSVKAHQLRKHSCSEEISWHQCKQCSHKSKCKDDLAKHILRKHTPERIEWYHCLQCSYRAVFKYDLKMHVLHRHTVSNNLKWYYRKSERGTEQTVSGQKEWYQCAKCSYKARFKSKLRAHVVCKHTDSKVPYVLKKRVVRKHNASEEPDQCEQDPTKSIFVKNLRQRWANFCGKWVAAEDGT